MHLENSPTHEGTVIRSSTIKSKGKASPNRLNAVEFKKLHDSGWALHWLRPKSKIPVQSGWTKGPRLSWKEFQRLYRKDGNVGVRLGAASKLTDGGYLAVLDLDVKSLEKRHAEEAEQKLFELFPEAKLSPKVLSGRGNGSAHFYVRVDKPLGGSEKKAESKETVKVPMPSVAPSARELTTLSIDELAKGYRLRNAWEISLLSEGRQAVLPGSIHPDTGRLYRWANEFDSRIPTLAAKNHLSAASIPKVDQSPSLPRFQAVNALQLGLRQDQLNQLIDGTGVTDRSGACFGIAMALMHRGYGDDVILSLLTDRTLFLGQTAFDHAKTDSRERASHWLQKYTLSKARAQVNEGKDVESEELPTEKVKSTAQAPLAVISFDALRPSSENTLTLIEDLLGPGGLSVVYGPPGAGKSFFSVHLSFCIARNQDAFGKKVKRVAVLYFAAESPRSIEQRFYGCKQLYGESETPLAIVPSTISLLKDVERIIEVIDSFSDQAGQKVGFVVIDTLPRASAGADENSAKDMASVIQCLDRVREATGTHIMLIHHAGKDLSKGARGSNALLAAADTEIFVENLRATVTKQRDGDTGDKLHYELKQVPISTNAEGETITVPVVHELQTVREVKPLKGQKKLAFDLLKKLLSDGAGEVAKADWQAHFVRAAQQKADAGEKSLQRAFRKVADFLRAESYIAEDAGMVRLLGGGQ